MYTYDEALLASKEYFGGEELPAKVFLDKYALRDNNNNILEKTPDDMHRRLAREFARIEKSKFKKPFNEEKIYSYFKMYEKILPQGSPIFAIGNPYQVVSASNCFVTAEPEDSYSGILKTDLELVSISKRRGGVGTSLNKLRPKNSLVKNAAKTSTGIKSWMERYSNSIREVAQNGRRGALLLSLNVHHPEIETFITAKNDETSVTGANISVHITDTFMQAVLNNTDYEQRFPIDVNLPSQITKRVNAKEIWDKIVYNAWLRAEPGLQFIDMVRRESPADCYSKFGFRTITSNPCQPGYATVLTKNGIKTINDINIGDMIWSENGWSKIINKINNGLSDVYKYSTTSGYFVSTKNHKIISNGKKIEAQYAIDIDIITGPECINSGFIDEYIMDGLVLGDGSVHEASNDLVHLNIGQDDYDYFSSEIKNLIVKHHPGIHEYSWEINTSITKDELPLTYNRKIPDRIKFADEKIIRSFLRGLYSANGSVCDNRITLKQSSLQIIEDVQLMLSSIGIRSYYTTNKTKKVEFSNGIYDCKESYDLNITVDREKFVNLIGFIQKYKNQKIQIKNHNKIKNIFKINKQKYIGQCEVFDITVDNLTNTYWSGGCNVANCGEIFLSAGDSCRLFAINLFHCVKNPYTKDAYFDFNEFYETAQVAQRLMDDLVDLEIECIDRILQKLKDDPESKEIKRSEIELWKLIKEQCVNGRRTGLGITALGDTLAALNIIYGSVESIEVVDEIYKTLKFGAYRSSVDIAKELGPFPVWDHELEKDNPFLNRFKDESINYGTTIVDGVRTTAYLWGEEIWNDMNKYGRRNIACLTTAPVGTLSTQASMKVLLKRYFNTSSGIESIFKKMYIRRKKGNPGDKNFRSDFVDKVGDHWMEFPVYHSGVQAWKDVNNTDDLTDCPYIEANDVNWINKVRLQAAAQKHVDHSISVTCNVPNNITPEEVGNIYLEAYKSGCKGFTIYREGSRSGVLIDVKEKSNKSTEDRPKELPCEVFHTSIKGEHYFVLVGIKDDKPYEVFAGKNGFLDKNIKTGKIIRQKKRHYKAIFEDDTELSPITATCNEQEETITRLTSALLRTGASMHIIVQQLERVGGDMHSFAKGLSRILKKYIPDGTKEDEKCPECQAELVRESGCKLCKNCSYSVC